MRNFAVVAGAVMLLCVSLPTPGEAQWVWIGGGGSFPVSDYGDYAKTGVLLTGGVGVPVGEEGLSLFGEAFWGQNGHSDFDGDKTNPYGFMGGVQLDMATEDQGGPYFFGEAGILFHKYSSDTFDGDTSSGFGYGAGAGYSFPLGGVNGWIEGRAMNASIDGSKTSFVSVLAGVSIPVSGS
ncbi:MAG: hypothetical protein P8170_05220 [Gemmatimonadota bacterium]|jgi:hypothetical protein